MDGYNVCLTVVPCSLILDYFIKKKEKKQLSLPSYLQNDEIRFMFGCFLKDHANAFLIRDITLGFLVFNQLDRQICSENAQ